MKRSVSRDDPIEFAVFAFLNKLFSILGLGRYQLSNTTETFPLLVRTESCQFLFRYKLYSVLLVNFTQEKDLRFI